jgi:hypothetical protein
LQQVVLKHATKLAGLVAASFLACGIMRGQIVVPKTPLDCQKSISAKQFSAVKDGPVAEFVGYSKAQKGCVVVVRQVNPSKDPKQLEMATSILDAQTRKPLWNHSGPVAFNGRIVPQDPALGSGLKQLQADVLPALR